MTLNQPTLPAALHPAAQPANVAQVPPQGQSQVTPLHKAPQMALQEACETTPAHSSPAEHPDTAPMQLAQRLDYIFRRVNGQANSSTEALQRAVRIYRGVAP
ncbi:hypothetical protein DBR12_12375 [Acidovorax sp. HMWF029]|nr:hypothetical protein DBR12_12375 [Acidovorax sp. HMWF029]